MKRRLSARATTGPSDSAEMAAERGARYREVAGLLLRDYDIIPLWQEQLQVVAQPGISGIVVEPNFYLHYDLLERQ